MQNGTVEELLYFYTEKDGGEGVNFPIDFTQYRYLFIMFKYGEHVLDSAFIPVSIFIAQCYNSEKPIVLNNKLAIVNNSGLVAGAEVSCNPTGNNFYVFINQPYYPVVVWGIK